MTDLASRSKCVVFKRLTCSNVNVVDIAARFYLPSRVSNRIQTHTLLTQCRCHGNGRCQHNTCHLANETKNQSAKQVGQVADRLGLRGYGPGDR